MKRTIAQEAGFIPRACNLAAGWENGKVEWANGNVRRKLWPCALSPTWPTSTARPGSGETTRPTSASTGKPARPRSRPFQPVALLALPAPWLDYTDTACPPVPKDARIHFDGNRCDVPSAFVNLRLALGGDGHTVRLFREDRLDADYPWDYGRGRAVGTTRFKRELRNQRAVRCQLGETAAARHLDGDVQTSTGTTRPCRPPSASSSS